MYFLWSIVISHLQRKSMIPVLFCLLKDDCTKYVAFAYVVQYSMSQVEGKHDEACIAMMNNFYADGAVRVHFYYLLYKLFLKHN